MQNQIVESRIMTSKLKTKAIAKSANKETQKELGPRRSGRSCKGKFHDSQFVGHQQIDKFIGIDSEDDQGNPRRLRKKYFRDDGSDYEDNNRYGRKRYRNSGLGKRQEPRNAIQGLLRWRYELSFVPEATKENSKLIKVKSITKEPLEKHAQAIEALFINIQWNQKGQRLEDFKNLKIQSTKLMDKGIIFIWAPPSLMNQIVQIMLLKNFIYVQNLQIGLIDRKKVVQMHKNKYGIAQKPIQIIKQTPKLKKLSKLSKQKTKVEQKKIIEEEEQIPFQRLIASLEGCNPSQFMGEVKSDYFNKSKKTLFFFRKISEGKLQLRHQRTCDAVFDMPINLAGKCQIEIRTYLYEMIQTLLPRALKENVNELKMMELWSDHQIRRRGWIMMTEQ